MTCSGDGGGCALRAGTAEGYAICTVGEEGTLHVQMVVDCMLYVLAVLEGVCYVLGLPGSCVLCD